MHNPGEDEGPQSRRLLLTFVWIFLAATTVLIAIAAAHYYSVYRSERIGGETAERVHLELARQTLVADIASVVTDLMVLARHIEQVGADPVPADSRLEQVFTIFAEQKRLYDQIRYIDISGKEILRVNVRDGRAWTVPPAELQDKSARYYVDATLGLAPNEVYISPLDLNVEQGKIERPFKPMMRFATAILDPEGRTAGIVVLNYLGQRLLDAVKRAAGPAAEHLHLVEPRGYWLLSPDPEDDWGFMLGNERTFAGSFPREWQQIRQRERGQRLTENGLFTYATVSPHPVARAAISEVVVDPITAAQSPKSDYAWKIISHLPLGGLVPPPGRFLAEHGTLYGAMSALLALGSFLIALARAKHHRAELQSGYERRFRRTLEEIRLAAVSLDRSGRVTFCNRFFLELTDWSRAEVVGTPWIERFIPEEEHRRMAELLDTLDTPEQFPPRYTCEVLTRAGERRLLAWHNSLSTDSGGQPAGVTAIGEDITDKRHNEATVRKLSQAVEQSPSILIITDRNGLIEYVNPKFTEVTGYTFEEVAGENPRILKSGETSPQEFSQMWHILNEGGEWRGEFHNRRKNGELYWESASISALRDPQGRITHFLAVKEDITENKRLQQEVETRNRELARAHALAEVGRMATMIAHDLRNPLSSVKIALQVLSKPDAPSGEARELRAIAREQVAYMEAILSDMLTYARPQTPIIEWLSAERLLQTVVGLSEQRFADQGVVLATRFKGGLPTLPGDPNQLRQVFSNLIANAVQATEDLPRGERRVSIRTGMELGEDGTRIRVEVCDNGRGINEKDSARLFEPFYTTRSKGTGLGLAIVRKIIDQHRGRVSLRRNRPRGTCADVLLPTVPDERNEASSEQNVAACADS